MKKLPDKALILFFSEQLRVHNIAIERSEHGIYIGVEDTGIGADAETVRRMFDPFVTTRITEESTGLGLSIVQRIINDHNGTIDAKCQPGGGCTFTIHLPAAPDGGNGNG